MSIHILSSGAAVSHDHVEADISDLAHSAAGSVPADSGIAGLFLRPSGETVHADDDEFDTDSSADYTSTTPTGTVTKAIGGHALHVIWDTLAVSDMGGYTKALTAAVPVTLQTAFQMFGTANAQGWGGLCFANGTAVGSDFVWVGMYRDAGDQRLAIFDGTFTLVAGAPLMNMIISRSFHSGLIHMRLIWSAANTWKFQVSPTGLDDSWTDFGNGTETSVMTPTRFGVGFVNWGGTEKRVASFEYLRITAADLSL